MLKIQVEPNVVTRSSFHFHLCTTFLFFEHHNVYSPSLGDRRGYCYDFPHSFSFLCHCLPTFLWTSFFILVLLIYDYSSTVCLLRRLFMHCPCAYSCAYSCTACLLMDSLTVQYIRTEWTLLFCS